MALRSVRLRVDPAIWEAIEGSAETCRAAGLDVSTADFARACLTAGMLAAGYATQSLVLASSLNRHRRQKGRKNPARERKALDPRWN